ncbi:MAG: transglycosylase domain-containing protein [Prolixibacteraceae bacterium]|nr:transglycosylase domain-containing protein [Prolixibacteraceae bacterium]
MQQHTLRKIKITGLALVSLIGLGVLAFIVLILLVRLGGFGPLPDQQTLAAIHNEEASLVYASDGEIIGKYFAENRTNIAWDEVPEHLVNALVATEDKRFFLHEGLDTRSYLRVFLRSIILGDRSSGGGSTLTQQLAKNLYGRTNLGFLSLPVSKVKEAMIASRLEKIYSKEALILLYLNSVPFGENVYGIESAAHRFFNKPASALKVEESAILIGMLKANTHFNPRLNPENATARRNLVLALMEKENYLKANQCDSLQSMPLQLNYENFELESPAGYFVYQVKKQAEQIIEGINTQTDQHYNLGKDGLRIYTTLNLQVQQLVNQAVKTHLQKMQPLLDAELKNRNAKARWIQQMKRDSLLTDKDFNIHRVELFDWEGIKTDSISKADSLWYYHKMLNAAVLITHPETGEVLGWSGGNHFRVLPFDMVLSHRQIASTFKPILYAAALESGFTPCTYLENEARIFEAYNNWEPQNFDHSSTPDSLVALWYALAHSMNLPSVDLYQKIPSSQLENLCYRLGFPTLPDSAPSLALGTADISLFEIVRAYGAFANQGTLTDLVLINKITDAGGKVLFEHQSTGASKVFSTQTADQITAILQRAINEGTGTKIRNTYNIKAALAGKTGTAHNYSDAWFIAYTPELVIGTWVGARTPDIRFGSALGTGSALALPIAGEVLKGIENNQQLAEQFFSPFHFADSMNVDIDCEAYSPKGIKGYLERMIKPGPAKEQKFKKEVKKFFRNLFKKNK